MAPISIRNFILIGVLSADGVPGLRMETSGDKAPQSPNVSPLTEARRAMQSRNVSPSTPQSRNVSPSTEATRQLAMQSRNVSPSTPQSRNVSPLTGEEYPPLTAAPPNSLRVESSGDASWTLDRLQDVSSDPSIEEDVIRQQDSHAAQFHGQRPPLGVRVSS